MVNEKNAQKGLFITLEGSEGSGKTTSLQFIEAWLKKREYSFIVTREPGGTILGEKIRHLLLDPSSITQEGIDPLAELLLVFAARKQHLHYVIEPSLNKGCVVVCDRFTDTTWAYQGGGRQLNHDWIHQLEKMVQGERRPDITFFFDIPVQQGLERASKTGAPDRFEKENIEFFTRIRSAYLERAAEYPQQYRVIDARHSIAQVNHILNDLLSEFFHREL